MEELVIGDKTYVSSKRASEITGYAKDYIGQLCREGRVQATLVGRSWYVLESSIREHRFGGPETPAEAPTAPVEPGIGLTWSAPVYKKEAPPVEAEEPVEDKESVLENMQTAWQDWFKTRGENKEAEAQESVYGSEAQKSPVEAVVENTVVDTVEEVSEPVEEASVPVTISMIEEPEEIEVIEDPEEAVPVYRTYNDPEEAEVEQEKPVIREEIGHSKAKTSYVGRSLLIVVAGVAVLVAVIGSGSLDFIASKGNGIQQAAIYYLSGVKEVK
jgi:hypothetical protein